MGTGKHCWYSSFWNSQFFDCEEAPVEKSLRNNFSQRGSHYAAAVLTWLDKYKHKYKFKQNWQIPKHTCGSHRFSCSVSFLFAFCIKVWFCRMLVYRLHQLASSDKTAFRRFWRHTIKTGETNHQQQKRKEIFLLKQTKKKVGSLGCRYQAVNVWNVAEGRPTIWEKSISLQFHRNDSVLTLLLKFIEMIPTNSSQSAVRPFLLKWGDILKPACPKSFARNSEIFFPKKIEV